jgi:hypothetical protein
LKCFTLQALRLEKVCSPRLLHLRLNNISHNNRVSRKLTPFFLAAHNCQCYASVRIDIVVKLQAFEQKFLLKRLFCVYIQSVGCYLKVSPCRRIY